MPEILAYILMAIGLIFFLIGIYGIWKNQNFYVSLTVAALLDTVGFLLFGLGILFLLGFKMVSLKILFLMAVFLFINPLGSHMLARAANTAKTTPQKEDLR